MCHSMSGEVSREPFSRGKRPRSPHHKRRLILHSIQPCSKTPRDSVTPSFIFRPREKSTQRHLRWRHIWNRRGQDSTRGFNSLTDFIWVACLSSCYPSRLTQTGRSPCNCFLPDKKIGDQKGNYLFWNVFPGSTIRH